MKKETSHIYIKKTNKLFIKLKKNKVMKYAMLQIKKETHELLKKYCEEHGFKMGSLVENLIKKHVGVPKPTTGVLNADKVKNQSY